MGREFGNVSRLTQALAYLRPGLERPCFGVAVSRCSGLTITMPPNPALNRTLRDKAAQRRLAPRWAATHGEA